MGGGMHLLWMAFRLSMGGAENTVFVVPGQNDIIGRSGGQVAYSMIGGQR